MCTWARSQHANAVAMAWASWTKVCDGAAAKIGDHRANTFNSGMYSDKGHYCGFKVQVVAS